MENKIKNFKNKYRKLWFIITIIFYLILSCSLYAFSMTCFVNSEGSNIITSGLSGVSLIISRYVLHSAYPVIDVNVAFSVIHAFYLRFVKFIVTLDTQTQNSLVTKMHIIILIHYNTHFYLCKDKINISIFLWRKNKINSKFP